MGGLQGIFFSVVTIIYSFFNDSAIEAERVRNVFNIEKKRRRCCWYKSKEGIYVEDAKGSVVKD